MKKSFAYIAVILSLAGTSIINAANNKNILDIKESITDSNIVFPESFETNSTKLLEGWYMQHYAATDDRYSTRPDQPANDAVYKDRLSKLPVLIEMPYNQIVKSYIERYTDKGRAQVTALLGLSYYYLPIFEQALEEEGLPLELKYLPMIESGLDPNAVSKHGATGLWQFMLQTGKGLGMEVNSLVDERRDPYLSSKCAVKYLKDLYKTYGDWSLAIAAYNCGPGSVNKAIRRAGGDPNNHDYWSIYYFLPAETRGYVPAFIAANYVMTYYPEHNISPVIPTRPLVTDTIHVNSRVHFNQISSVLDIPVEELRVLNPQFRADIIPGNSDKTYTLILPSQQVHAYLMSEEDILNYESEKYARRLDVEPGGDSSAQSSGELTAIEEPSDVQEENPYTQLAQAPTIRSAETSDTSDTGIQSSAKGTHKVKPGETLADIANLYGVSPQDIKTWNNLRRNAVRTGQILRINGGNIAAQEVADNSQRKVKTTTEKAGVTSQKSAASDRNNKKKGKNSEPAPKTSEYKIQSGDNLSTIARKHGVSVEELKKANGMTSDKIRAGGSLKIPAKGKSGAKSSANSSKGNAKKSSGKKKSRKR